MENQNKYLILARRAREENNTEDARKYYDLVRTEDPDNAEAKFFYSYYRMMDGTKGESYNNFVSFCNGINSTLSMIISSDDSEAEKKAFFEVIINCMKNAHEIVKAANIDIGGKNSRNIGSAYRETMGTIFTKIMGFYGKDPTMLIEYYTFKKSCVKYGENYLIIWYNLGDEIESKYASIPEVLKFALDLWKECIDKQQREYNTTAAKECSGWAEKYAEKIKKYEPTYVMPKKAGCVTIGKPTVRK